MGQFSKELLAIDNTYTAPQRWVTPDLWAQPSHSHKEMLIIKSKKNMYSFYKLFILRFAHTYTEYIVSFIFRIRSFFSDNTIKVRECTLFTIVGWDMYTKYWFISKCMQLDSMGMFLCIIIDTYICTKHFKKTHDSQIFQIENVDFQTYTNDIKQFIWSESNIFFVTS